MKNTINNYLVLTFCVLLSFIYCNKIFCINVNFENHETIVSQDSLLDSASDKKNAVERIIFVRKNVFDLSKPENNQFPFNFLNKLHYLTRESILKNELLFSVHDSIYQGIIDESEVNLRKLGIFNRAEISVLENQNGKTHVEVCTEDKWSTQLITKGSYEGNFFDYEAGVEELNLFGRAQQLKISLKKQDQRNYLNLKYLNPRINGTHLKFNAEYLNFKDGRIYRYSVKFPYFAYSTSWSMTAGVDKARIPIWNYENGEKKDVWDFNEENFFMNFSHSTGGKLKIKGSIASEILKSAWNQLSQRNEEIKVENDESSLDLSYVLAAIDILKYSFQTDNMINAFGTDEDFSQGFILRISLGKFINSDTLNFLASSQILVAKKYENSYFCFGPKIEVYRDRKTWNQVYKSLTLMGYTKIFPGATLMAYFSGFSIERILGPFQYSIGSTDGLRGYKAHEFSGNTGFALNIEVRTHTFVKLWLVQAGGVIFMDIGNALEDLNSFTFNAIHKSIGLGLRFGNSEILGDDIFRLDFAYSLESENEIKLSFSSKQYFSPYVLFDYIEPFLLRVGNNRP